MATIEESVPQITPPPPRDPLAFAPVFVLAPVRSNASVISTMVGQHPELSGLSELALFRADTVEGLLRVKPQIRLNGTLRALAQLHDGEQTDATVAAARRWLEGRRAWRVEDVYDHLLALAAPRAVVQKSPEDSSSDTRLARIVAAYPRARFLHVTRHPAASAGSMHRIWTERGYLWLPERTHRQFCLAYWYAQHDRIRRLLATLPPERGLQVRSEEVLNSPGEALPRICSSLGVDPGPAAVEEMLHPERSPFARLGPPSAPTGGGDEGFTADPIPHPVELPPTLELPADWAIDPQLAAAATDLARRFGYRG